MVFPMYAARSPKFLSEVPASPVVADVHFVRRSRAPEPSTPHSEQYPHDDDHSAEPSAPPVDLAPTAPSAASTRPLPPSAPIVPPASVGAAAAVASQSPPPPAASAASPPGETSMTFAQLSAALETLRLQSERLAEQARSDALEIGFQVARRILNMELTINPEPLFSLIRSAIARAGESHRLVVRLHPGDLSKVETARAQGSASLSVAQLELKADASLNPGDCVVDADFGSVDGRLETRVREMRQAVERALEDDAL